MKKKYAIGIIGWGNMGAALGTALASQKDWDIFVYDKDRKKTRLLKNPQVLAKASEVIEKSDIVILAIKPQDITNFISLTKGSWLRKKPLLLTIAAGISTHFFESRLNGLRVIRIMPNMAVKVKEALSFICRGKYAGDKDVKTAGKIFSLVGNIILISEEYLDKVTALTGSGPGFIFYFMDAFYKAALNLGFRETDAKKMVIQTFWGAGKLAKLSDKEFSCLIKEVASPCGTTEAGLAVFNQNGADSIINNAIYCAYKRAEEISRQQEVN